MVKMLFQDSIKKISILRRLRKETEKMNLNLNIYHPEKEGDPTVFAIRVVQTFKKPMPRQSTEAVFILNRGAAILMNSKAEFRQPAIPRVTTTREPPGGEGGGGQRGRGREQREARED